MRAHWTLVLALVGCAAQPGARPDADEIAQKDEALVGASCEDDSACDAWEHCNRIVCITTPCPSDGHCADIHRWYDNEGAAIPDADPAGVTRTIHVERPASNVAHLTVGVNIDHTWRGDLRVVLRSPAGTEHVLHDRTGGNADDLNLSVDLTSVFEGETAVGDWQLTVSDNASADTGRILTWTVELDYAEAAPPVEDGRNIWSEVVVPSIESDHDYANDTDQTWDLRPFSGGATRARIRFSRIETERGYDFVEVVNMDTGAVIDRFDGTLGAFTTHEYDTGNLGIRLVSDYSVTAWGFAMEHVEVFGLGCLDDDDCGEGTQCPTELVRCIRFPCFLTCQPTTPGVEGDGCTSSADCEEDLFCAADGFCRRDGTCGGGDYSECNMPGNDWPRLRCWGYGTCTDGACGYNCGAEPVCTEGETRDDGCNVCSCSGGLWRCTERYCPPSVGEGGACGAGVVCDAGLTCDRGRTPGATCSIDAIGTCVADVSPRICTRELAPVCACNGQTFSNECGRIGIAPYAHEGECELSVAIPDMNATGISQTLSVVAPTGGLVYEATVRIDHTYRGDLVVWLEDPDGNRRVLTNRAGGSADDFELTQHWDVGPSGGLGTYTLHVEDRARADVGVLRFFNVVVR
ncbi:MAG: proprotein convertase P-domain-containing protein [Sandaracinaceae bacterium]|nr:proprotein convertase P-domain-containing protein [Sandaracinaceae bacterium]